VTGHFFASACHTPRFPGVDPKAPLPTNSDRELLEGLRRGDPAAFERVYASEKAALYGFLLRLSRDPHASADLFQNVWLKLARNAAQLRDDSNVRAWLFTVARREYLSFRRAQALDLSRLLLLGLAPEAPEACCEDDLSLQAALARLADADREVLLLAASGLEHGALAEALGASPAAVRQRLTRARRRLTQLLDTPDTEARREAAPATKGGR
jgi:RNA polymerase sigma-70 factor, ECF subfamily